ncbi:hypothetical protein [Malacoplasma iowae]|uniref:hypothetical protein n=1 Tax=Malacoplasma iowae TaxID=2116 RepID=UPI002A18AF90|nr:hypothetical protein [Malacoplasma iowae]WPL40394.1 hypothetical protein QX183_02475 [Malacoplasma iowae]
MKNKTKLILFSAIGMSAMAIPSLAVFSKNEQRLNVVNKESSISRNAKAVAQDNTSFLDKKGLDNISTSIGPIVMKNDKTIESRDWYGYANWTFDITSIDKTIKSSDSTTVVDWEYLEISDSLFLITSNSCLIKINATTGEVLASADKNTSGIGDADRISGISYNDTLYAWNSKSTSTTIYSVDRNTLKSNKKSMNTSSNSNDFLTTNKLQAIYPLDVGYNIALTTENNENDGSIKKVKATMVDDNIKPLVTKKEPVAITNDATQTKQEIEIDLTNLNGTSAGLNWNDIYKNSFYRSATKTTLLFIGNKAYEISLNKNAVEKSNITEITTIQSNAPGKKENQKSFNSSFIDSNNLVVFKREGDKSISSLTIDNKVNVLDLTNSTNNELKTIISNDQSNTNKLMVFGVPTEANKKANAANLIYLADAGSKFATGFESNIVKPNNFFQDQLQLKTIDSVSVSRLLPSQMNISNFKIEGSGADAIRPDNADAKFTVDDLNGSISLKLLSTRNAWYSRTNNIKTKTYLHYSNNNLMKTSTAINWASDQIFKGLYGKNTPGQITEDILEKNKDIILPSNNITSNNGYTNIKKSFLIVNRDDSKGDISIEATVTYTDKYNTTINYSLKQQTYKIKAASTADYKFEFYGQTNGQDGSDGNIQDLPVIDINSISGNSALNDLKKFIPSFIEPDPNKLADAFIKTQDSYPIAKELRNVYIKDKDDANGQLTIAVDYVGLRKDVKSHFERRFGGFQTTTTAKVTFKGQNVPKDQVSPEIKNIFKDETTTFINIKDVYPEYTDKISDEVTEIAKTYSDGIAKLSAMGYSPEVRIISDNNGAQYGYLQVELDYSKPTTEQRKKIPQSFYNEFGLKDGKITQVYIGFLPVSTRFGITLKNYYSQEVQNIVNNYSVESHVSYDDLLKTLNYKGYLQGEVNILNVNWNGEKLEFMVSGKSAKYPSVASTYNFTIDWAPKFASIRERNLILAVVLTLAGIGVVAFGIGVYILRKNKIRRLLK